MRRLVALSKLSPEKDEEEFEWALSAPSQLVRLYAHQRLTDPTRRAADTRQGLFERYAQTAGDINNPQRMEAISRIQSDYDPVRIDSPIHYKILSFMADLAADRNVQVRSSAVQYLYSKFFSDLKKKSDPSHLQLADREKVIGQLKQDIEDQRPYAEQAQKLLALIGGDR